MIQRSAYLALISSYRSFLALPPPIFDIDVLPEFTFVKLNLNFVRHPHYGFTKFRIREKYDALDQLMEYRYCWEISSKPSGHISAWENELHIVPHGFPTDPHHHHHVPMDRNQVQGSPTVRDLSMAFGAIIPYFRSGKAYP
jgi:hypothetical protein